MHISPIQRAASRCTTGLLALCFGVAAASGAEWASLNIGKLNDSGIFSTVFDHRSDGRFILGSQGVLTLQKTFGSAAQTVIKNGGVVFDPSFVAVQDDTRALLGAGGFFGPSGLHPFQPSSPATPVTAAALATLQNYVGVFWRHPTSGREGWLIGGANGTGGMHNVTFVSTDGLHIGPVTGDLSTYSAGIAVDAAGNLFAALFELDGSPNEADADKVVRFTAAQIDTAVAAVIAAAPSPVDRSSASFVHKFSSASSIAVDEQGRVWATGFKISALECYDPALGQGRTLVPDHPALVGAAAAPSYQIQTFTRDGSAYISYLATDAWGTPGSTMFYGYKPEEELPTVRPVLGFVAASQIVDESAGTVTVTVMLDAPLQTALTVPFAITGTATSGVRGDFMIDSSPLKFAMGETSKTITIQVRDDPQEEATLTETIILSLSSTTPGAQTVEIGPPNQFTLTLNDNDEIPEVTAQSGDVLVGLGGAIAVTPTVTGSADLGFQWERNSRRFAGQTQNDLNIAPAAMSHAGRYRLRVTNPAGSTYGPNVDVGVVDDAARTVRVLPGRNALIGINAAGPDLTFAWSKDGTPLSDDADYEGTQTPRLTVRSTGAIDEGAYRCRIATLGGATLDTGAQQLIVAAAPVAVTPTSSELPTGRVGAAYSTAFADFDSEVHVVPTRFVASGLPSGLKMDATTGIISGRPTVAGPRDRIYITASNIAGSIRQGPYRLAVDDYDANAQGTFVGLIDRSGNFTGPIPDEGLGARFDLVTTRSGSFSGRVTIGTRAYPFRGLLDTSSADPVGSVVIRQKGLPIWNIDFAIDVPSGEITATAGNLRAWRAVPRGDPALTARLGRHHWYAEFPGGPPPSVPEGGSYASATVTSSGLVVMSGRTALGDVIVSSARLGTNGEALVYRALERGTATFFGELSIAQDAPHSVGGLLTWSRVANSRSLLYPLGWSPPIQLQASGSLYSPAKAGVGTGIVLGAVATDEGISNALLEFTGGGVGVDFGDPALVPSIGLRVTSPANVALIQPNPNSVSLRINNTTGLLSGSFTVIDGAIRRRVAYQGMIVPPALAGPVSYPVGLGYFLLPELPATRSSLRRSGFVLLSPVEP